MGHADLFEQGLCAGPTRPAVPPGGSLQAHLDVLGGAEGAEQLEPLEGAGQPQSGPAVGPQVGSRCARRCNTSPWSGRCSPLMTLNRVVLPAPLGPISPVT